MRAAVLERIHPGAFDRREGVEEVPLYKSAGFTKIKYKSRPQHLEEITQINPRDLAILARAFH